MHQFKIGLFPAFLLCFISSLFPPALVNAGVSNLNMMSAPAQYKVSSSAGLGGAITPTGVQTVRSGGNLTYTSTPEENYLVYQWLVDGKLAQSSGTTFLLSAVKANHTVEVTFSKPLTVTSSAGTGGTISPIGVQPVKPGSSLKFIATPNTDYVVNQWLVDGKLMQTGGTSYSLTTILASHTVEVTFTPTPILHTLKISAGAGGTVSPTGTQTVTNGASQLFIATPNAGYNIYQWLLDGAVVQTGGTSYTLSNITANHNVGVTFTNHSILYAGTENGAVYYSNNNGTSWSATQQTPSTNTAVNSISATKTKLYAATEEGTLFSSSNNGGSWVSMSTLDGTAINSIYVTSSNYLYVGTKKGDVYYSKNGGANWTTLVGPDKTPVTSVFVTANNILYVGTAKGNVYYSTNSGSSWSTIAGPDSTAVRSIFVTNTTLYVGTANEYVYTSTSLTRTGTWVPYAQSVYSLFVNSDGSNILAGTQGGYVFSLSTGNELGFIKYTPIKSVFLLM